MISHPGAKLYLKNIFLNKLQKQLTQHIQNANMRVYAKIKLNGWSLVELVQSLQTATNKSYSVKPCIMSLACA